LMSAFQTANGGSAVIAFGAQVSFDAIYSVPVANAGTQINNTVTVNAHHDENEAASNNANDSITYDDVTPSVSITTSHSGTITEATAGQTIIYHFTVLNPSTARSDSITAPCPYTTLFRSLMSAFQTANGGSAVIAFGAQVSFDAIYSVPVANAGT